jgi:hypothetical protein
MEMADSPRLPAELILKIIDFAASHGISGLRSLMLTCKSIHPQAEFLLYEKLNIPKRLPRNQYRYWPRLNRILKTIGSNNRVASLVKSFIIELPTIHNMIEELIFLPLLTKAFTVMFNLKRLSIVGDHYPVTILCTTLYVGCFQLEQLEVAGPLRKVFHSDEDSDADSDEDRESDREALLDLLELLKLILSQQCSLLSLSIEMRSAVVEREDISHIKPIPASIVPNLTHIEGSPVFAHMFLPMRPNIKHLSLCCENAHERWRFPESIKMVLPQIEKLDIWSSYRVISLAEIAEHCSGVRYFLVAITVSVFITTKILTFVCSFLLRPPEQ